MRFRQLECFERVCELGSITQAASTLNVAQTALGLQIRQLEDEMGCPLLSRTSRGVAPTDAGRIFLDSTAEEKYGALSPSSGIMRSGEP